MGECVVVVREACVPSDTHANGVLHGSSKHSCNARASQALPVHFQTTQCSGWQIGLSLHSPIILSRPPTTELRIEPLAATAAAAHCTAEASNRQVGQWPSRNRVAPRRNITATQITDTLSPAPQSIAPFRTCYQ